jgi:ketosteroid isomerase-like protein
MILAPFVLGLVLQAPSSKAADAETEQFLALETRVSGALQIKNLAALDELLARDFAFNVFLQGRAPEVQSRSEWLKFAESYYTLSAFEIRNLSVRRFGDVAVVRLQPTRKAAAGAGLDRSGEFAVVDVWTKEGDVWKLTARYSSRPDAIKR